MPEADNRLAVVVYSRPNCQQCKATYRKLDDLGIRYRAVDVEEFEGADRFLKFMGYQTVPVVMIPFDYDGMGGRHWSGFRPDLLTNLVQVGSMV